MANATLRYQPWKHDFLYPLISEQAVSVPSNATFVDGVQGMTGSVALWGNCGMLYRRSIGVAVP
jgi:hypothetical protein